MAIVRIPIVGSVDPESEQAVGILESTQFSKNVFYEKYPDGRLYATQRASIDINNKPEYVGETPRGRGAYYWEKVDASYQVVNGTIFKDYGGSIGSISVGLKPVDIIETDNHLVIIDSENNEGWVITQSDELREITDTNFPPNAGKTLASGGVWLDSNMYVLDTEGNIWNSVENDPESWDALNFIEAGRYEDAGKHLAPHGNGIAAFGSRSIEFFYNAGNPVGSPLARRNDIVYHTGVLEGSAVAIHGDSIYFLGSDSTGTLGIYYLDNYALKKISTSSVDALIANSRNIKDLTFLAAATLIRNHRLLFLSGVAMIGIGGDAYFEADYLENQETYVTADGTDAYAPQFTLVYDASTELWSTYDSAVLERGGFPVLSTTSKLRNKNTVASVMFINGEVGQFTGLYKPTESSGQGGPYFADDDYIEDQDDYILFDSGVENVGIDMEISLPEYDAGTMTLKFGHRLELVGTQVNNTDGIDDVLVSWSDDHYRTYSTARPIKTSFRAKLTRLGKFKRRAHRIQYSGIEQLRIEGVELDVRASQYAR